MDPNATLEILRQTVAEHRRAVPLEHPLPNLDVANVLRACEASKTDYSRTAELYRIEGNQHLYEYYKGKAHGFMVAGDLLFEAGVRWRESL